MYNSTLKKKYSGGACTGQTIPFYRQNQCEKRGHRFQVSQNLGKILLNFKAQELSTLFWCYSIFWAPQGGDPAFQAHWGSSVAPSAMGGNFSPTTPGQSKYGEKY